MMAIRVEDENVSEYRQFQFSRICDYLALVEPFGATRRDIADMLGFKAKNTQYVGQLLKWLLVRGVITGRLDSRYRATPIWRYFSVYTEDDKEALAARVKSMSGAAQARTS